MKKTVKILVTVALVVLMVFTLVACSANPTSSGREKVNVDVTLVNGDISKQCKITLGEQAKVDTFTKSGYYFAGYFSSESGGTKYFDTSGKSLGIWQEGNPAKFYAQWDSVYNLQFNEKLLSTEDPDYQSYPGQIYSVELPYGLKNGISGNLDKNLEITFSFKAKDNLGDTMWFIAAVDSNRRETAESFASETVYVGTSYVSYTFTFVVSAVCAKSGYANIHVCRSNNFREGYLKDASIAVKFAQ